MSRKPRDPNRTRISPMCRLGQVIEQGNEGRNLTPTLADCTRTWPVSPQRPDFSLFNNPRNATLNFPQAIWFACCKPDVLDPSRNIIAIKNPSPAAIRELYFEGWLRLIMRAAAKSRDQHPEFPAFLHTHVKDMIAYPERRPSSLTEALDVFIPPWQLEPVWKFHRLR